MARNKHPDETVNLILDVSFRLFMEKGYEHTSIQDIIDHLGGLSKGAIYHHFKSKEDILEAVTDRMTAESYRLLASIRDWSDLNGREKLQMIFRESLNRSDLDEISSAAPDLCHNIRLLFSTVRDAVNKVAPDYILPVIEQGIADGSIQTDYPDEVAELIILAVNVWLNPMVFNSTAEASYRKTKVLSQMMKGLGIDIIDDEMAERMKSLTQIYQDKRKK